MCEQLKEAVQSANNNTNIIAKTIDQLNIPCDFKGVFMHLTNDRGFKINKQTFVQMLIIGETRSQVCLDLLTGNHKKGGLICAYRLAAELDNDKQQAEAVQLVLEYKRSVDEKSILLEILTVRGR